MIAKKNLFSTGGVTESDRSIHTPSSFARQNLLYVQEVGRLKSLEPHRCIREKLDSFLFMVVLKGEGIVEISGRHYEIREGSCVLIDCMEHYEHFSSAENAWELAWVHFNGGAARAYYELFLKYNNGNVFQTEDVHQWNQIIGELLEKQNDKKLLAEMECGEILMHLCNGMIARVMNADAAMEEEERQLGKDIRECLNEEYADSDVLDKLPDRFGRTLADMDAVFTKYFGIHMEEYVWNRRFNAAKELLRFTIKPISEVIRESGLGDVVTLQRLFRENENVSAEEYRMRWAQWIK